jgi:hypothetical protein
MEAKKQMPGTEKSLDSFNWLKYVKTSKIVKTLLKKYGIIFPILAFPFPWTTTFWGFIGCSLAFIFCWQLIFHYLKAIF